MKDIFLMFPCFTASNAFGAWIKKDVDLMVPLTWLFSSYYRNALSTGISPRDINHDSFSFLPIINPADINNDIFSISHMDVQNFGIMSKSITGWNIALDKNQKSYDIKSKFQ